MPQAIGAFVADAFAFGVAGATVGTAALIETAVTFAASGVLNVAAQKLLAPSGSQGGAAPPRVLNTTVRQSAAARRLIFGTVKTGGVFVYAAQSTDGADAWLVTALGEGEIDGLESTWWVGDELSTDSKFTGLLTREVYTGTASQTASAALIAASGGEWTSAETGTGVAYVVTKYTFARNAFPRGLVWPTFTVRGLKLYDPRTATTVHSANPALALLWFIRSEFGYRAPDALIDFDSFAAAASVCDELVDSIDPANVVGASTGKVRRYTINGVFETAAGPAATVAEIERCMAGRLVFDGEKYRCYAGAWRAPTGPTLTAETLRAAPTYRTHPGRQQRINVARGTYREPKQDWQETSYAEQQLAAAVIAEDGEIVQSINYPAVTNGATAQRLARIAMREARAAVPLILPCNWAAMAWRLYDTIAVDLPELGITADSTWLITAYTFVEGGGIDITCVPHNADVYAWDAETDEQLVPDLVRPSFNSLPPAITGLSTTGQAIDAGQEYQRLSLSASWTAVTWARLLHYEVQWKPAADSTWDRTATVTAPYWETSAVRRGVSYDVRVRVIGAGGEVGDWASTAGSVANDTTAPDAPGGAAVDSPGLHVITWTNPAQADFRATLVYADAALIATVPGRPSALMRVEYGLPAGTVYTLASIDGAGNTSSTVTAGTGTSNPPLDWASDLSALDARVTDLETP